MTDNRETIAMLKMLKEQALKSHNDTAVLEVKIGSFNFVLDEAIKALEQEPRKGEWLRMSNLSENEDDRYKCSRCGNVVHYRDKINLYTFNSWCGRCGSDNRRKSLERGKYYDNLTKQL